MSNIIEAPEKILLKTGCNAKATASPAIPNPVSNGPISNPHKSKIYKKAIIIRTIFKIVLINEVKESSTFVFVLF